MPKGETLWFRAVKLTIWTAAILLFFRFLGYLVGGNFREFWLIIATASTLFITFLVYLLKCFRLPDEAEAVSSIPNDGSTEPYSILPMTKEPTAMANNENPSFTFTAPVSINTTTNHNAPGGIISNAPVTINQYYDKPKPAPAIIDAELIKPAPASANAEQQNQNPEPAAADDVIDINSLIDFSATVKSPGVSRNTIDKILREKNIKPCRTEKNDRAIRNLYPAKESKAAIREYFDDKKK